MIAEWKEVSLYESRMCCDQRLFGGSGGLVKRKSWEKQEEDGPKLKLNCFFRPRWDVTRDRPAGAFLSDVYIMYVVLLYHRTGLTPY